MRGGRDTVEGERPRVPEIAKKNKKKKKKEKKKKKKPVKRKIWKKTSQPMTVGYVPPAASKLGNIDLSPNDGFAET